MNPAMLLNPRAYAKEKSKEAKKKRAPNYGPKQTRKPSAMEVEQPAVVLPSYDAKTLLAPKGSASAKSRPAATDQSDTMSDATLTPGPSNDVSQSNQGNTSLYERHHGVVNREAPMGIKRKAPIDIADDDDSQKRQKSTFGKISGSTILTEHMKKERERLNFDAAPPVDLTEDNDDDDDLAIIGTNNLSKEVCLGMITVIVNAHSVPAVSAAVAAKLGVKRWPAVRVRLNRPHPEQRQNIEVYDAAGKFIGKIDFPTAHCLSWLMDGSQHTKFRIKAFLRSRDREPGENAGDPISRPLKMDLTLYSMRSRADKIGSWIKSRGMTLGDPIPPETSVELYNPHKKTVNGLPDYRPDALKKAFSNKYKPGEESSYVQRTQEEMRRETQNLFDRISKHDDLPEMELTSTKIKTKLKQHQKQALRFLVEHERYDYTSTDTSGYSLWKPEHDSKHGDTWYNVITLEKVHVRPDPTCGGILADMMGLGKSLSILSLIAETGEDAKKFAVTDIPEDIRTQDGINSKATLIVCPTSVLASWEEQIQTHAASTNGGTKNGTLSYFIYHGANRTRDLKELAKCNIVLTSYGILAQDFQANHFNRRTLMRINWFRVVLDEAHTIRNAGTVNSKACCELTASRRWAVTGTPIQNRLEDLGALIKFLRVKPFDDSTKWAQYITAPFKMANPEVLTQLRLLIDSITLRRTRDIIKLPERHECIVRLQATEEEQKIYSLFASQSNLRLQSLVQETGTLRGKSMIHILRSIGRLRMLCAHGKEMLSPEDMEEIKGIDQNNAIDLGDEPEEQQGVMFTHARQAYDMLQLQIDGNVADCAICRKSFVKTDFLGAIDNDTASEDSDAETGSDLTHKRGSKASKDTMGYLTPCWHLLHPSCKVEYERATPVTVDGYHECSTCTEFVRNEYFELTHSGLQSFINEKSKRSRLVKKANIDDDFKPHTKVQALIAELKESAKETESLSLNEPPIRSVVFTEWTTYLDLIELGLKLNDIDFLRLDGSMSLTARRDVLTQFREDPQYTVLLISIRAGGQGLNLTAANKVYLMEPQYNPGVEQQAVDRVHRLGQQREVFIKHFVMTGSVEEGVMKLQEKKTQLAQLSLDRKKGQRSADEMKQKIEDLRELFRK